MKSENWLERAMREAENDPVVIANKEMLSNIIKVSSPNEIFSVGDIPEFLDDAHIKGIVKKVQQGQMGFTEDIPIRTDNVSDCNVFLIKTKIGEVFRYILIHVWAGDLDFNVDGSGREDIKKIFGDDSVAIGITGGKSTRIDQTAMSFKKDGVNTIKHIDVPSGNRYISVVFRPKQNDILVRIGTDEDSTEVWSYDGF